MLVITAVCLTSVLDSVRSETPQRSLPSLIMVVIIVSVRVIAMAWTFKKNISCLTLLAREQNWRRIMPTLVKATMYVCDWAQKCVPFNNLTVRKEEKDVKMMEGYEDLEGDDGDEGTPNQRAGAHMAAINEDSNIFLV